jgi:hypothetical protein
MVCKISEIYTKARILSVIPILREDYLRIVSKQLIQLLPGTAVSLRKTLWDWYPFGTL